MQYACIYRFSYHFNFVACWLLLFFLLLWLLLQLHTCCTRRIHKWKEKSTKIWNETDTVSPVSPYSIWSHRHNPISMNSIVKCWMQTVPNHTYIFHLKFWCNGNKRKSWDTHCIENPLQQRVLNVYLCTFNKVHRHKPFSFTFRACNASHSFCNRIQSR